MLSPRRNLGSLLCLLTASLFAVTPKATMMPPLVAPVFMEDDAFSSTIGMVNASSVNTYATVTVRSRTGGTINQKKVPLAPHSALHLPVRDLLREANSAETTGSIVVEQSPELQGMVVLAQLAITYQRYPQASYIDEEFSMPSPEGSQILRAVSRDWGRSSLVGITSLSGSVQQIRIDCLTRSDKPVSKIVELGANSTLITPACSPSFVGVESIEENSDASSSTPEAIGIQLVSSAAPAKFAAFGFSRQRKGETLAFGAIAFADPKLVSSSTIVYPGVPVGVARLLGSAVYKPYVAVANFSLRPARVTVSFSPTSGDMNGATASNAEVGHFTVQAKQTTIFSLGDLQGDPEMRNAFMVSSDAVPGEIAANLASTVAGGSEREVELLGKDADDPTNAGFHPWSIANGDNSTLFLFNHTAQPQRVSVAIASGDRPWQKVFTLAPFETRAVEIRRLIEDVVKDNLGKGLPSNLVEGQIDWTVDLPGRIKGRLLLTNDANGMARSFSCAGDFVPCGSTINPTSSTLQVGNSATFSGQTAGCIGLSRTDCNGTPAGSWQAINSWSSSGSSISPPNCSGSNSCSVSAVSPGNSSITFQAQTPVLPLLCYGKCEGADSDVSKSQVCDCTP